MEDDLGVDIGEVLSVINTAEVFVVMFQIFERRLLVDTRTAGEEMPLVRVVDRARNSEARFRELQRLRPRFAAPERIVAFQWPRSVRTFVGALQPVGHGPLQIFSVKLLSDGGFFVAILGSW